MNEATANKVLVLEMNQWDAIKKAGTPAAAFPKDAERKNYRSPRWYVPDRPRPRCGDVWFVEGPDGNLVLLDANYDTSD